MKERKEMKKEQILMIKARKHSGRINEDDIIILIHIKI